jgi:hypothetical protein
MATPPHELRTFAFGDADGGLWGAALDAGTPALVFGAADVTASAGGAQAIAWSHEDPSWRLAGDGFELLVSPAGSGESNNGEARGDSAGNDPLEELCQVSGVLRLDGAEHAVQCPGTRSVATGLDLGEIESVRSVSGWFSDDDALSLLALRPAGSAGPDRDLLAATVFAPEGTVTVDEPRLSTTYQGDGLPARTNLELWIGEGEDQVPRRAAAEALSSGGEVDAGGVRLRVTPLRCHSRGLEGVGVYLLARF